MKFGNIINQHMEFKNINKRFVKLYKNTYGLCNIKEWGFISTNNNVLICFVVKTEKDKTRFSKELYDKCCCDYLNYIGNLSGYKGFCYEFMLLSEEEVRKKYDGNYYYAML